MPVVRLRVSIVELRVPIVWLQMSIATLRVGVAKLQTSIVRLRVGVARLQMSIATLQVAIVTLQVGVAKLQVGAGSLVISIFTRDLRQSMAKRPISGRGRRVGYAAIAISFEKTLGSLSTTVEKGWSISTYFYRIFLTAHSSLLTAHCLLFPIPTINCRGVYSQYS